MGEGAVETFCFVVQFLSTWVCTFGEDALFSDNKCSKTSSGSFLKWRKARTKGSDICLSFLHACPRARLYTR